MRKIDTVSNVLRTNDGWAIIVADDNNMGDVFFIKSINKRHEKMFLLMKQIADIAQEELNEKDSIAFQGL